MTELENSTYKELRKAAEDARDYIIGLGQSPEAEGWPRDQYAVTAQLKLHAV